MPYIRSYSVYIRILQLQKSRKDVYKRQVQSWSRMDFGTGKIIFLDITQKEDMLQVEYPNYFLLDMGWYQDLSLIHI